MTQKSPWPPTLTLKGSFRNTALPLLPTHSDHTLMVRHALSLVVATTPVLSTVLHMDMSPLRDKGLLSTWEHTSGRVHSLLSLCPTADTQVPAASGGKQQHPWGGSVQTSTLQDLAFLPRSLCEPCFFPRAASLTCVPSLPFQLQWGPCTEPRLQSCWLLSFVFAFRCLNISSLFSR